MPFDKQKAFEQATAKLATQEKLLKATLDEITYVEREAPELVKMLKSLRTKRDRQQDAIEATKQTIELYKPDPNQLALPVEEPKKKR